MISSMRFRNGQLCVSFFLWKGGPGSRRRIKKKGYCISGQRSWRVIENRCVSGRLYLYTTNTREREREFSGWLATQRVRSCQRPQQAVPPRVFNPSICTSPLFYLFTTFRSSSSSCIHSLISHHHLFVSPITCRPQIAAPCVVRVAGKKKKKKTIRGKMKRKLCAHIPKSFRFDWQVIGGVKSGRR